MRAIVLAACVCATGCELYFGPGDQDAAPPPTPDASLVVPDAHQVTRPDPPGVCSNIAVYVSATAGDPRGPFLIAELRDALAYYYIPIVTTPPSGNAITIAFSPTATKAVDVPVSCSLDFGSVATIADDRGRSNEEIVANAQHGLGLLFAFPPMANAGDCMNDVVVPGCMFGRADSVARDPCGQWTALQPIDEAQMLATHLGCP